MVTKRIRSEYMKKFKDPKWETYTKCYEEMLKYRLTRRLMEHAHNPWFWGGSETDSDSGGRSPNPLNKVQVQPETIRADGELEECERARIEEQQQNTTSTVPRPALPLPEEESPAHASKINGAGGTRVAVAAEEEREEQRLGKGSKHKEHDRHAGPQPQGNKSFRQTWRNQRVRPAPAQQPKEDSKVGKHPFALYGSGEKDADISSRKTHNVRPAASTTKIHESALRAKTRREVERQIQTQRAERRRAKSADLDKAQAKIVQPEFNPWLTEYMRCFSSRSR